MKKFFAIALSLFSIILMSSCKAENFTVERIALSKDEQKIAGLTSDIAEKFLLEKDRMYDICVYLYKEGSIEKVCGLYGIDVNGEDRAVLISGRKDGGVSFA